MKRHELKLLLLQIRDQEKIRKEELASFARYCQLEPSQIDALNVFDSHDFKRDVVAPYDALLIGGASEASVLEPEKYPFIQSSEALIQYCVEVSKPVFASCYGFQAATLALGGTIIRDPDNYEMGTIPIQLTSAAKTDPVFKGVNSGFLAVSVHVEKALVPPPGAELLAYTEVCCHAFKVQDKPFWAFQFHPEVDKTTLVERLTFYKAHYTQDDAHLEAVLTSAEETPESNRLMKHFVDRVLLKGL